jgi:Icc-related predicted phosphoesterase
MRIVCIADLHVTKHQSMPKNLPDGDVLVIAGDICGKGLLSEVERFDEWLYRLEFEHKIVIAGNHDHALAKADKPHDLIKNGIYLQDSGVVINGRTFWGSPWQPRYFDGAFDLARGCDLEEVWKKIPGGTDVLITHTPPFGILDQTRKGKHIGCKKLVCAVLRINPIAHIFGHVHECAGVLQKDHTVFVNSSISNARNLTVVCPKVIDI